MTHKLISLLSFSLTIFAFAFIFAPRAHAIYCDPPISGNWTITEPCVLYEDVNGPATGDITLQTGTTLTLYAGKTLAWYPNQKITIPTGAVIIIQNTGKIQQRKICYMDSGLVATNGQAASGYSMPETATDPRTGNPIYIGLYQQVANADGTCPSNIYALRDNLLSKDYVDTGVSGAAGFLATTYRYLLNLGMAVSSINGGAKELQAAGNVIRILGDNFQVCKGSGCNNTGSYGNLWVEGNVGIGTTNPTTKLHIYQTETTGTNLTLSNIQSVSSNGGGSVILHMAAGTGTFTSDFEQNNGSTGPFRYGTYADTNIVNNYLGLGGPYANINFATQGATRMTVMGGTLAGNVGIGTTNPGTKLEVNGAIKAGTSNGYYIGGAQALDGDGTNTYVKAGGTISFWPGNTQLMTLLSTGYLGIGQSPTSKLHVLDISSNIGVGTTNYLISTNFTATKKVAAGVTDSGYHMGNYTLTLRNYATTADSGTLVSQYSQYLNYGHYNSDATAIPRTTNSYGLFVQPYAITGTITNMFDIYLAGVASGGTVTSGWGIYQANSKTNYFAGTVGIGTATPTYKLQVQGTTLGTYSYGITYGVFGDGTTYGVYGRADGATGWGTYCNAGYCGGTQAWTNNSDFRLKKDIHNIDNALDKVLSLRGVTFKWKDERNNRTNMGFIAQEILPIVPEVVMQDKTGYYYMQQGPLTALLTEAIKEQQKEITSLKDQLATQQSQIDSLQKQINELKNK